MEYPEFVKRDRMTNQELYISWLSEVKSRVAQAQSKAVIQVNTAMLELYWSIGRDLVSLHPEDKWGKGIVRQFALDMREAFPDNKGFSDTNIKYMRRWYEFYNQTDTISQQPADQIEMPSLFGKVPWFHHVLIFTKSKNVDEALFYVNQTIEGNWSRRMLEDSIQSDLYNRQGQALTNFENRLPATESQLAKEILKDPYNLDFLTIRQGFEEKELEDAIISNITRFLLELGQGFAFVGRQMELRMPDGQSYFPDLIFYHIPQKRYVVVELKAGQFAPEYAGKINFYVTAADRLLKDETDNQSVGLIICKAYDKTIVEWSLQDINKSLGVAASQLQEVVERTIAELKLK
ncbi:MAG: PDDEXK nuclease domain-containing protein [Prevotellaceae bacterium]|nr:PDDEXK nuclease domain-containing protein [Prevotellaceae bacterium]